MAKTHISELKGRYYISDTAPSSPRDGELWFNYSTGYLHYWDGDKWLGHEYTSTSTSSTSTSTTTTSTSTSTTSSTSSSTTTTSTSTSI